MIFFADTLYPLKVSVQVALESSPTPKSFNTLIFFKHSCAVPLIEKLSIISSLRLLRMVGLGI
jgi:hypothetical protein